ncbi:MAG: hydroxymethylglutaryl-CoA synthase [Chitinophagales bacterium]
MKVGIDCMAFDVPKIHLQIENLANERGIEPGKLINGLGLKRMTLPDVHQDIICFAANAAVKLIEQNNIDLSTVSRIYVGTESGIDSSKPAASYILSLLEDQFQISLGNCDAVDFKFACIGAVDALHNTLDFIRLNPGKKAIVVSTDIAKYDLASSGEYTQGAGALAMLLCADPRMISFSNEFGVSTAGVFDFFKPRRIFSKSQITGKAGNDPWMDILESEVSIYKEQPVFDGQYSNQCYIDRTRAAYENFKKEAKTETTPFTDWHNILMHLPYAFQGRRTFAEIYAGELTNVNLKDKNEVKALSKSKEYLDFVEERIAPSEKASSLVGNLYTGSIFMAILSALSFYLEQEDEIAGKKMGFIAYGSGSKSKVFEVAVEKDWKSVIEPVELFAVLEQSTAIDFDTYEGLHKKELKHSILSPENEFVLDYIEQENEVLKGARYYKWM